LDLARALSRRRLWPPERRAAADQARAADEGGEGRRRCNELGGRAFRPDTGRTVARSL